MIWGLKILQIALCIAGIVRQKGKPIQAVPAQPRELPEGVPGLDRVPIGLPLRIFCWG